MKLVLHPDKTGPLPLAVEQWCAELYTELEDLKMQAIMHWDREKERLRSLEDSLDQKVGKTESLDGVLNAGECSSGSI